MKRKNVPKPAKTSGLQSAAKLPDYLDKETGFEKVTLGEQFHFCEDSGASTELKSLWQRAEQLYTNLNVLKVWERIVNGQEYTTIYGHVHRRFVNEVVYPSIEVFIF